MCAVPNMAVFCSSLTSCFSGMLLTYFLNDLEIVPVAPIITGITFVFTFHMRCISIVIIFFFLKHYNFREVLAFSASFLHLVRFLMHSFQCVISIFVMSLFTSSSHLFLGLHSDLVCAGDHSYSFFTMLVSGIRCTCPNQANLCAIVIIIIIIPLSKDMLEIILLSCPSHILVLRAPFVS